MRFKALVEHHRKSVAAGVMPEIKINGVDCSYDFDLSDPKHPLLAVVALFEFDRFDDGGPIGPDHGHVDRWAFEHYSELQANRFFANARRVGIKKGIPVKLSEYKPKVEEAT